MVGNVVMRFLNCCTNLCFQLTVVWKLVEKLLMPKPTRPTVVENKSTAKEMKWSFAPGTNLLSGLTAKIDRESKQKLNEFAKELRSFRSVDMSGKQPKLIQATENFMYTASSERNASGLAFAVSLLLKHLDRISFSTSLCNFLLSIFLYSILDGLIQICAVWIANFCMLAINLILHSFFDVRQLERLNNVTKLMPGSSKETTL